ncbi:hypothetical protein RJ639_047173 [Escallonia herrerae]|uniref:Uncharacterized protein n=1 Tax=Escallonia herrerae TaxID=1293975 RepID=A0AA88W8Y2_9ASTE|nr:hypothetical protein RJ639_047173 [Escallonia herrerae]
MSRRSTGGTWLRCCLIVFAIASALCVSGPALYWKFKKVSAASSSSSSCPTCSCDCPPPLSLQDCSRLAMTWVYNLIKGTVMPSGLVNLSVTDCGKSDPDLNEEMEKQFVDLLTEELKLQEKVVEEHLHHMNTTFGEARRLASQYQREAEKCNSATEICEGAREHAEALLTKERKVTSLWERRARQLGWEGE